VPLPASAVRLHHAPDHATGADESGAQATPVPSALIAKNRSPAEPIDTTPLSPAGTVDCPKPHAATVPSVRSASELRLVAATCTTPASQAGTVDSPYALPDWHHATTVPSARAASACEPLPTASETTSPSPAGTEKSTSSVRAL